MQPLDPTAPWPGPRTGSVVLFLDFDGVLHPGQSGTFARMPVLAGLLRTRPDLDLVLSSSWRLNAERDWLRSLFPPALVPHVRGITPELSGVPARREAECLAYVRQYGLTRFLAIDDDRRMFRECCPFLFLTNNTAGLDEAAGGRLLDRLSREFPLVAHP